MSTAHAPIDLIRPIEMTLEVFKTFDYMLFEPSLFNNAHNILKELDIDYKLIGANLFDAEELTPTLVALNTLTTKQLDTLYAQASTLCVDAANWFDCMFWHQNLIQSDLDVEPMAQQIADMMLAHIDNEAYLFRIYDPRVAIHTLPLLQPKTEQTPHPIASSLGAWQADVKQWVVSVGGQCYHINMQADTQPLRMVSFDGIRNINDYFRRNLVICYDDDWNRLTPSPCFEQLYNSAYAELMPTQGVKQ